MADNEKSWSALSQEQKGYPTSETPEGHPTGALTYDAAERGLLAVVLRSAIRIETKKLAGLIEVHGENIDREVAANKAVKIRMLDGLYRKLGGDPERISRRAPLPPEWS
jgi:hypothetical protein